MKRRGSGPLGKILLGRRKQEQETPNVYVGVRGKYLVLDKGQQVANVTGTEVAK